MESITKLTDKIENLPPERKKVFESIFRIHTDVGELRVPPSFSHKVRKYYGEKGEDEGSVIQRIRMQTIVRTFNIWTGEAALFNQLRAGRPGQRTRPSAEKRKRLFTRIKQAERNCDFCNPESNTPEDVFGRIKGRYCITAANIAKYDSYNGIVIFNHHNPLEFSKRHLSDYVEVGLEWCRKVNEHDRDFKFPFFTWNCLERAGASQIHGHAQVLVARHMPYAKILALSEVSERYKKETRLDYFDALYEAHESVGLAVMHRQIRLLMYLTPVKEKEIIVISPSTNDRLKSSIFRVLRCYIDELGVTSFNLSIAMSPIGGGGDQTPVVTRIVDRGDIFNLSSDFGGMELYGTNVLASDPYTVFDAVKRSMQTA